MTEVQQATTIPDEVEGSRLSESTISKSKGPIDFDIKKTYLKFLSEDSEMTMPVAAIESLVALLSISEPSTASELMDILAEAIKELKNGIHNSMSLSAGCDLFQRFVLRNIRDYGDWEACRRHLVQNGRLFVERAKQSRAKIAQFGSKFIRDDDTVLVHGFSRAVNSLLSHAAQQRIRFKVLLTEARPDDQGHEAAQYLRSKGIPCCVIVDNATGWAIQTVDKVFIGAEGVAESGGVINHVGTYQIAVLAKHANKPFYVVTESHKFVRLFPLSPYDVTDEPPQSLKFITEAPDEEVQRNNPVVDFTPDNLVTALITDMGVLTPSGVSEELIKMWNDY